MSIDLADLGRLQSYAVLLVAATLCIYAGSYYSLRTPLLTSRARKAHLAAGGERDWDPAEDADERTDDDKVTAADAYLFPILGSGVLFSMYLAFKYLDAATLNALLGVYFGLIGGAAVFQCTRTLSSFIVTRAPEPPAPKSPKPEKKSNKADKDSAKKDDKKDQDEDDDDDEEGDLTTKQELAHLYAKSKHFIANLTALDWFVLLPASVAVVAVYVRTRHWAASNAIAVALAWEAVGLIELDKFLTGAIVLGGLFLYDIFWVFGTNVMVNVARNFDAPIKIVWPRNLLTILLALYNHDSLPEKWELAMLGLGDIVIPGCFVALALRFDQHQYASTLSPIAQRKFRAHDPFPTPYFTSTIWAYFAGLVLTMTIMTVFNAAQPALLYLSPACVGAVVLTALARKEWSTVWAWTDTDEEKEKEKKAKAEKKGQEAKQAKGKESK